MDISGIRKLFGRNGILGNTIFHELAYVGSLTLLYRFRDNFDESFRSFLQETNNDGENSIHVAANTHRGFHAIRLIEELVNLGVDLNARDRSLNMTVLHIAVHHKDYALAKWLRQQPNVDINVKNFDGLTAYGLACLENDEEMMRILRWNRFKLTACTAESA
uniref:Vankyrin 3 n=1 Tax=Campoletis sonorensis ichnovirus TaxID=10484 RepID=Q56IA6_CSIV|nr:vankyrin 3 [Ichnoviriform sonorense]